MKICSICKIKKPPSCFGTRSSSKNGLCKHCKQCENERGRKRYSENREGEKLRRQIYYQAHREQILDRQSKYWMWYYNSNLNFRLAHILRTRLRIALKNKVCSDSVLSYLGCSIEELKTYLESQFQIGMSWNNYGDWHIDHIIPLCSFDLNQEKEIKKAAHYKNLQPLWAADNLIKGDRNSYDRHKKRR